eukprot:10875576-Alexandrium_andersonii.AAC.1
MPAAGRRPGDGPRTRHARRAHRPPKLTLGGMAVVRSEASPVRVSALLVQGLHFGHRHEGHELQRSRRVAAAQPRRVGQHRCVVRVAVVRPLAG